MDQLDSTRYKVEIFRRKYLGYITILLAVLDAIVAIFSGMQYTKKQSLNSLMSTVIPLNSNIDTIESDILDQNGTISQSRLNIYLSAINDNITKISVYTNSESIYPTATLNEILNSLDYVQTLIQQIYTVNLEKTSTNLTSEQIELIKINFTNIDKYFGELNAIIEKTIANYDNDMDNAAILFRIGEVITSICAILWIILSIIKPPKLKNNTKEPIAKIDQDNDGEIEEKDIKTFESLDELLKNNKTEAEL